MNDKHKILCKHYWSPYRPPPPPPFQNVNPINNWTATVYVCTWGIGIISIGNNQVLYAATAVLSTKKWPFLMEKKEEELDRKFRTLFWLIMMWKKERQLIFSYTEYCEAGKFCTCNPDLQLLDQSRLCAGHLNNTDWCHMFTTDCELYLQAKCHFADWLLFSPLHSAWLCDFSWKNGQINMPSDRFIFSVYKYKIHVHHSWHTQKRASITTVWTRTRTNIRTKIKLKVDSINPDLLKSAQVPHAWVVKRLQNSSLLK